MAINRAEQSIEQELVNRIHNIERFLETLKTRVQPVGGDALLVQGVPTGGAATGLLPLAANAAATLNVAVTPANQTLTLWNFAFDIRVDVNDADHQFPNGSALTTAQRQMRLYNFMSWGDSSDTTNQRMFKVRVENYDTVSHDYYLVVRAYFPKLVGTGVG